MQNEVGFSFYMIIVIYHFNQFIHFQTIPLFVKSKVLISFFENIRAFETKTENKNSKKYPYIRIKVNNFQTKYGKSHVFKKLFYCQNNYPYG